MSINTFTVRSNCPALYNLSLAVTDEANNASVRIPGRLSQDFPFPGLRFATLPDRRDTSLHCEISKSGRPPTNACVFRKNCL